MSWSPGPSPVKGSRPVGQGDSTPTASPSKGAKHRLPPAPPPPDGAVLCDACGVTIVSRGRAMGWGMSGACFAPALQAVLPRGHILTTCFPSAGLSLKDLGRELQEQGGSGGRADAVLVSQLRQQVIWEVAGAAPLDPIPSLPPSRGLHERE